MLPMANTECSADVVSPLSIPKQLLYQAHKTPWLALLVSPPSIQVAGLQGLLFQKNQSAMTASIPLAVPKVTLLSPLKQQKQISICTSLNLQLHLHPV